MTKLENHHFALPNELIQFRKLQWDNNMDEKFGNEKIRISTTWKLSISASLKMGQPGCVKHIVTAYVGVLEETKSWTWTWI